MVFLAMSNEWNQDKRKKGLPGGVGQQNQGLRIRSGLRGMGLGHWPPAGSWPVQPRWRFLFTLALPRKAQSSSVIANLVLPGL